MEKAGGDSSKCSSLSEGGGSGLEADPQESGLPCSGSWTWLCGQWGDTIGLKQKNDMVRIYGHKVFGLHGIGLEQREIAVLEKCRPETWHSRNSKEGKFRRLTGRLSDWPIGYSNANLTAVLCWGTGIILSWDKGTVRFVGVGRKGLRLRDKYIKIPSIVLYTSYNFLLFGPLNTCVLLSLFSRLKTRGSGRTRTLNAHILTLGPMFGHRRLLPCMVGRQR